MKEKEDYRKSANGAEDEKDLFGGVYKDVMEMKSKSRLWSVIALSLGVLSVGLCFIFWLGLLFGIAALIATVVSRINLGYFDRISVAALIISIFGSVFSLIIMIGSIVLANNPELMEAYKQLFG